MEGTVKSFIYKVFKSLTGRWQLYRNIPNFGTFEGYASFKKTPDSQHVLFYQEEGTLKLTSGMEVPASKEYVYRYQDGQISAFFLENGTYNRLFHTLQFESDIKETYPIKAEGYHRCKNDDYDAEYNFSSEDAFNLTYKVDGPSKNYSSMSFFKRVAEAEDQNTGDLLTKSIAINNKL